jgi:folate-binding protein YgfZ
MQNHWSPLLDEFGATLDERGDVAFAAGAQAPAAIAIVPLANYGVLAVEGIDGAKFLQGQLTCDVLGVDGERATPGAYCTQKGRMLTSFELLRREENHYWLRMRADVIDNTARTLGKYIVFSKAKLRVRDDVVGFGLHGQGATDLLGELLGADTAALAAAGPDRTLAIGDNLLLQRDTAGAWVECWLPAAAAADFWRRCAPRCSPAGTAFWRGLVIRSGFGEVCAATAELFIPQMLNYHLNGAVNFKKGCYTGQEIVARTHYRGQVKRHVQLAQCEAAQPPLPAAEVAGAEGRVIGNVVDAVPLAAGRCELLVVVADGDSAPVPMQLADGGATLTPFPLPYAIN